MTNSCHVSLSFLNYFTQSRIIGIASIFQVADANLERIVRRSKL